MLCRAGLGTRGETGRGGREVWGGDVGDTDAHSIAPSLLQGWKWKACTECLERRMRS